MDPAPFFPFLTFPDPSRLLHLDPSQLSETVMFPICPNATVMTFPSFSRVPDLARQEVVVVGEPPGVLRSVYQSRGLVSPLAWSSLPLARIAWRSMASEGVPASTKPTTTLPRRRARRVWP